MRTVQTRLWKPNLVILIDASGADAPLKFPKMERNLMNGVLSIRTACLPIGIPCTLPPIRFNIQTYHR